MATVDCCQIIIRSGAWFRFPNPLLLIRSRRVEKLLLPLSPRQICSPPLQQSLPPSVAGPQFPRTHFAGDPGCKMSARPAAARLPSVDRETDGSQMKRLCDRRRSARHSTCPLPPSHATPAQSFGCTSLHHCILTPFLNSNPQNAKMLINRVLWSNSVCAGPLGWRSQEGLAERPRFDAKWEWE